MRLKENLSRTDCEQGAYELTSTFRDHLSKLAATPFVKFQSFLRRSLAEREGLAGFENEADDL